MRIAPSSWSMWSPRSFCAWLWVYLTLNFTNVTSMFSVFYLCVTSILPQFLPVFYQYFICVWPKCYLYFTCIQPILKLYFTWKRWGLPRPRVAWGVPAPCRPGWGCRWGTGVRQSDGPTWRSAWSASPAPAARFYLLFPLSQSPERSGQCQSRGYVQRYLGRYVENALTKVLSRFDPTWVCRDISTLFIFLNFWTELNANLLIANSPCHKGHPFNRYASRG